MLRTWLGACILIRVLHVQLPTRGPDSAFLLVQTLGSSEWWLKYWGSWHPQGDPGLSFQVHGYIKGHSCQESMSASAAEVQKWDVEQVHLSLLTAALPHPGLALRWSCLQETASAVFLTQELWKKWWGHLPICPIGKVSNSRTFYPKQKCAFIISY